MTTPNFQELAGRSTDPRFYAALSLLPNPDPILRRAGLSEEIFDAIQSDAHVVGELRLVRADLLRFEHRLELPDNPSRAERRAFELCQAYFDRNPAPLTTWTDVRWQMGQAPFRGQAVHEIVWGRFGDVVMPEKLLDRPNRRFRYNHENQLRYITRDAMVDGRAADDAYFLVNRHWASYDNPYGVALLSSCFWPYTFKHAGFRWFVRFCERHGLPWPVGKYAPGTDDAAIDKFEEALASMIEAGYLALQDDQSVELHEAKGASGGGKLAQHLLIEAANAEMSKALSSQTLSTESPNSGSRAASVTHRERSADVNEGDREAIAYTLDALCALIVRFNFGDSVRPPTNEFIADSEVTKERAEIYDIAIKAGLDVSATGMAAELAIELADPSNPVDSLRRPAPDPDGVRPPAQFAAPGSAEPFSDQATIDETRVDESLRAAGDALLQPVMQAFEWGLTPAEIEAALPGWYPQLDDAALEQLLARALFVADVWGRLSAQPDNEGAP